MLLLRANVLLHLLICGYRILAVISFARKPLGTTSAIFKLIDEHACAFWGYLGEVVVRA